VKYDFSQDPIYIDIANDIIGPSVAAFEDNGLIYTIAIFDEDSEFLGVLLYDNISPTDCNMHIATVSPRWCTRDSLRVIFTYPFLELGLQRVTAGWKESFTHVQTTVRKMGFTNEGKLRNFYRDGDAQMVAGLLKNECRWIDGR